MWYYTYLGWNLRRFISRAKWNNRIRTSKRGKIIHEVFFPFSHHLSPSRWRTSNAPVHLSLRVLDYSHKYTRVTPVRRFNAPGALFVRARQDFFLARHHRGITISERDRVRWGLHCRMRSTVADNVFGEEFRTRRVGKRRSRFTKSFQDLTRLRGSGESDENVFERVRRKNKL